MTYIIAFTNHKGGVGKTSTVGNLGAALARLNKKVLLIDLDAQCNLSQSIGVSETENNLYSNMRRKFSAKPVNVTFNLDLIPASVDLAGIEVELNNEPGREYVLKEIIAPFLDVYDYILIDCPPSLGILTLNAYTAANKAVIVLQAEYLAMHGLSRIIDVIEKIQNRINPNLQFEGIVITQFNSRKVLNKDIVSTVEKHLGDKVFNTFIRENIAIAEAPSLGLDIFRYNSKSNGAEDYSKLAKEMIKRFSSIN
jgi:chromosome partitioning protein